MKFIPKAAGMTKSSIAVFWNEEIDGINDCVEHDDPESCEWDHIDTVINYAKISDRLAQYFVDTEYDLRDEYVDESEEELCMARRDLILDCIRKYEKTAK